MAHGRGSVFSREEASELRSVATRNRARAVGHPGERRSCAGVPLRLGVSGIYSRSALLFAARSQPARRVLAGGASAALCALRARAPVFEPQLSRATSGAFSPGAHSLLRLGKPVAAPSQPQCPNRQRRTLGGTRAFVSCLIQFWCAVL